jgi:hypothetical protein
MRFDWRILEPGNYFSTSCHPRLPHRRVDIQCEHPVNAKAPRSTGSSGSASLLRRAVIFRLYISEGAHAMADAVQHNLQDPNNLTTAYALLSRMRLSASTDALARAEGVIQHIRNAYSSPTLLPKKFSPGQPSARIPGATSVICCAELEAMHSQLQWRLGGISSRLQSS